MVNRVKTKEQLDKEISQLNLRIAELEMERDAQSAIEEVLRKNERRYRSLVEQATEPLYCFECTPPIPTSLPVEEQVEQIYQSVLVECNDVFARTVAKDRAEEVINIKFTELIDIQANKLDELLKAIIMGGYRIIDGESVETLEGGRKKYYLNNAYGVVENGMLLRIWGSFRDITGRKETEQRLNIISSAIAQSDVSVAIIDLGGKILYANSTFFDLNRSTPEEIIGHNWRSFLAANSSLREKYPEIRETLLNQGKTWIGEIKYHLQSGKMGWRESRFFPIKNESGGITHIVYICTDITDRKKAEMALQESERRYRLLIENVPTVAWVSNKAGETVFISENVEKVYGFSAKEILEGGEALWLGRIHPEDKKRVQNSLKRLFTTGQDFRVEYRIQRKDGKWIWILDHANIVEEIGGKRYAYGIFSDISESKQYEEALQLYIERLKILYQINQGILIAQSPAEIAQIALRWVRKLIPCYRAGVALFEVGSSEAKIIALEVDEKTKYPAGANIQLSQLGYFRPVVEKLQRGQIVIQEYDPAESANKIIIQEGIRTVAFIPLIYEGTLIGSLNLSWQDRYTMLDVQEDIAREVAAQLSIAISQTQLQETEKHRRRELELLAHISTALRYAEKLEDLYFILFTELKSLFNTDSGAVLLPNSGKMACAFVYGSEEAKGHFRSSNELVDELTQILLQRQPCFESERGFGLQGISSSAVLPFESQEVILGGIALFWSMPHDFSEEERRLLTTVVDVAGIALHRMNVLETLEQRIVDRTSELTALYDVTAVSSRSLDLQEILDQSLIKVLGAMKCEIGIIHLLDDSGKTLQLASCQGVDPDIVQEIRSFPKDYILAKDVFEQEKAVVIPDLGSDPRSPEVNIQLDGYPYAGVPIRAKDRILGALSIVGSEGSSYNDEAVSLLVSIADQIGIAIENARLYKQAQQAAILSERHRLASDLHDSVTQSLYSLNLMAVTGRKLLEVGSDKEKIAHSFDRLGTTAHQTLKEMRLLLYELRPSTLEEGGLVEALRQRLEAVEGRADIKTQLRVDDLPPLPSNVEEGLYHIAQEALNNALKHAESNQTDVTICKEEDGIKLTVQDYGKGFVLQDHEHTQGMGLASMRDRARVLGSELQITTQPGSGTSVSVRVKVTQAVENG